MVDNRLWVPEGTEILTTEGWTPIQLFYSCPQEIICIVYGGSIKRQSVKSCLKRQIKDKLSVIKSDNRLIKFYNACVVSKDEFFNGFEEESTYGITYSQRQFNGHVYHIDLPDCAVFLRNVGKVATIQEESQDDIFTQDDYEEGRSIGFSCLIDATTKVKRGAEKTAGIIPDYWISLTNW